MSIMALAAGHPTSGPSILNLSNQLDDLQTQLATGKDSTTYAGQGVNRGFALACARRSATSTPIADTTTNVNTRLNVANPALQGLVDIGNAGEERGQLRSTIVLNSNGQTTGQNTARRRSSNACRCSTPSPAIAICFPDAPSTRRRRCRPTTFSTATARRPD